MIGSEGGQVGRGSGRNPAVMPQVSMIPDLGHDHTGD